MDKVEKGVSTAGKIASDVWKQGTTKVTKEALMRQWVELNRPGDVDTIGQLLARNGVPQEYIMSLFSTMGLPAPQNLTPAKTKFSDDDITDMANAAMHGGPALTTAQKARLDAIRKRQGFGPVNVPVDDGSAATTTSAGGTAPATAGGTAGSSAGDGQTAMATTMILPQIYRMVGLQYVDDLIIIIDTAMSRLQSSSPTIYREKIAQLRGQPVGKKLKPVDKIVKSVKNKEKDPTAIPVPGEDPAPDTTLGLNPVSSVDPHSVPAEVRAPDRAAESRKVFGGRYIKESADVKVAREFEKFVMAME